MLTSRKDQRGSGTAIGVAIMFPMLMLVIVAIQALTESSRLEQAVQSAANRAARTASLCCYGTYDAGEAAAASLAAAADANASNRVHCNNNIVGDASVVFTGPGGADLPGAVVEFTDAMAIDESDPSQSDQQVPPGGTVYVFVRCVLPPQQLGAYGLPGLDVERRAVGSAAIDPYRHRPGSVP